MTPFTPNAHTPAHGGEVTLVRIAPPGQSIQDACFVRHQPTLTIQLFGDGRRPLTASMMKNTFGSTARNMLDQLEQYSRWTHDEYQRAKADLRERYPSPFGLWQAFGKVGPFDPLITPVPTGPSSL